MEWVTLQLLLYNFIFLNVLLGLRNTLYHSYFTSKIPGNVSLFALLCRSIFPSLFKVSRCNSFNFVCFVYCLAHTQKKVIVSGRRNIVYFLKVITVL